jgi:hypothetical protein
MRSLKTLVYRRRYLGRWLTTDGWVQSLYCVGVSDEYVFLWWDHTIFQYKRRFFSVKTPLSCEYDDYQLNFGDVISFKGSFFFDNISDDDKLKIKWLR